MNSRALVWMSLGIKIAFAQAPPSIEVLHTERRGDVEIRDVRFDGENGPVGALIVAPVGGGRVAGVLYAHWYDSQEANSNRLEFLPDAIDLARRGQMSLLIDTMWSNPAWYGNRNQELDYEHSVQQVKNIRRGLDVLLSDKRVDAHRVALVGHDFGAIYGAVAAASDARVKALVLMSPGAKVSDWYMYGKFRLEGDARTRYVDRMAEFDTVQSAARVKCPVLIQFANFDFYVPRESMAAFRTAQPDRSRMKILLYESGHGLGWDAARDRNAFLIETFHLRKDNSDILLDYFNARNAGGADAIESFYAPDYRDVQVDRTARRKLYDFEKATKSHFEYKIVEQSKDFLTIDLTESSEYYEALGSGVSLTRRTYRFRNGKIRAVEVTSWLNAGLPYERQSQQFSEWLRREKRTELEKTGETASRVTELVKEWRRRS